MLRDNLREVLLWDYTCKNHNLLVVWTYLLMNAASEDGVQNGIPVKKGELITSYRKIASDLGLSVNEVRTALVWFTQRITQQTTHPITQQTTHQFTHITICNYESYELLLHSSPHTDSHSNLHSISLCESHTKEKENNEEDTRKETNEKETFLPPNPLLYKEKENKEKKTEEGTKEKESALYKTQNAGEVVEQKTKSKRFVPPTLDEVKAYVEEKGYTFDPEMFYNFYTANGWMMGKTPVKNWKACCGTWSRRDNNKQTKITNTNAKEENDALLLQYDAGDRGYGGFIHYIADNAPNVVQNVKLPSQQEFETITKQHRQHFAAALQVMNGYSWLSTTTFFSAFIKAIQDVKKTIDYGTLQQQNKQFADRVFAEDLCRIIERDARIAREMPDVPL